MHHLTIVAADRTGLLGQLSAVLGDNGINIADIQARVHGQDAIIQISVDRLEDALRVLTEEDFHVVADDSLLLRVADQPGALATIAQQLATAGVDIRGIRLVQRHADFSVISVTCDDNAAARGVLAELVVR
ncbi:ACT domain-containing protein [Chitinimonas sp.]|uniref:ACT domain-containing protein n=1 Tax=Chitinimonas sp. TaxID=1934313 RepID=UPI0035B0D8C4